MKINKFKAWNKKKKRWLKPEFSGSICVGDDTVVVINYKPHPGGYYVPKNVRLLTHDEAKELEIVQFTGLHDEHNEEIYEGHIVEAEYIEDNKKYIGKVIFKDGCFRLNIEEGFVPIFDDEYSSHIRNLKIIGNIFENPELMEEKNE